mmetsp:Transcript_109574/g.274480  ORF Transcript_109574/g.274480 Transcript_109574/m.274480 type:complete len:250 (-) Transcript_109574:610-1359(-)
MLELLLLILGLVKLRLAILLLGVVVQLLLLQESHHVINHLDDFLEPDRLAVQRQGDQVQLRSLRPLGGRTDHLQGLGLLGGGADLELNQARTRARQGLLEKFKRVIVVENLDGLRKRQQLLRAGLFDLLPLRSLCRAALLELLRELFIRCKRLVGVLQVIVHSCKLNAEVPDAGHPFLDLSLQRTDLLLFGCHQSLVVGDGAVLLRSCVIVILAHLIAHLLQDPGDLTALRRVIGTLGAGQKRKQLLPR